MRLKPNVDRLALVHSKFSEFVIAIKIRFDEKPLIVDVLSSFVGDVNLFGSQNELAFALNKSE